MIHEIAIKIKRKEWEENITLGWFASLVGGCSPRMVFSSCPPWLWGFFLEEEDERELNDESVYEWICRAPESYFISSGNASGVMTGRRALMGIPNDRGFSLDAKGFFNEIVFMIPE
jgi:hypothetical protein